MKSNNNNTTEEQLRAPPSDTSLITDNNRLLNVVEAPVEPYQAVPDVALDKGQLEHTPLGPVPPPVPQTPAPQVSSSLAPGPLAPASPASPATLATLSALATATSLSPTSIETKEKAVVAAVVPPVSPALEPIASAVLAPNPPGPGVVSKASATPTTTSTQETVVADGIVPSVVSAPPAPLAPVPPAPAIAKATTTSPAAAATKETAFTVPPISLVPAPATKEITTVGVVDVPQKLPALVQAPPTQVDALAPALLAPVPPAPTPTQAIATPSPTIINARKETVLKVIVPVAPIPPTHVHGTDQAITKAKAIEKNAQWKPTTTLIPPPPPSLTFPPIITASPSPPTTHNPIAYYAVRKGKFGLNSCIFLNWKDCEEYLHENAHRNSNNIHFHREHVEFASFPTIENAILYLNTADEEMSDGGYLQHSSSWQQERQIKLESCATTPLNTMLSSPLSPQNLISGTLRPGRSGGQKALANPNRRPTKAWEKMFDDLKAYKDAHGLLYISDKKEHVELSRWIRGQHNEYKYWKEGQPSSMFPMKIQKLLSIGFEFNYVSVEERFKSLLSYRRIHGNYNVPINHPVLGKWVDRQKKAAKKFSTGDPSYYFENTIKDLKSLGLDLDLTQNPSASSTLPEINRNAIATATAAVAAASGGLVRLQETTQDEEERKWYYSFEQLRAYKIRHHTCEVPPSHHTPLSYWVTKQHQEYQKVKEGNASKLTVNRLQRLNDLGFVFRKMGKTHTWEERMGQLKRYKEEFGHSKVPKSHPELGVFVNRQRYEYTKWIQGRASTMNEKRKKDLENLNFVFVAGKKMSHVDFKNKKTWDERYLELLQFRDVYGHTIVPQSYPGLGEWVHTQRTYYKKLKRGKQSPLTGERVLRLADVGFAFDATKRRGNHIIDGENQKV